MGVVPYGRRGERGGTHHGAHHGNAWGPTSNLKGWNPRTPMGGRRGQSGDGAAGATRDNAPGTFGHATRD